MLEGRPAFPDAVDELRSGRCLEIHCDGYTRVVAVYACRHTDEVIAVMLVWEARSRSVGGERTGWKLLPLDETRGLQILDRASKAPRNGYKPGDQALVRTLSQL
jgi:hypothetical protein